MGERAQGGAALSHPPPCGAPQTGPACGRLRQSGRAAQHPGKTQGPPRPSQPCGGDGGGTCLGSSARGRRAQPSPPRGCPQWPRRDAGGGSGRWPNKRGLCAARQPARRRAWPDAAVSICALVNRQRPEETAAAAASAGAEPQNGLSQGSNRRRCWGTRRLGGRSRPRSPRGPGHAHASRADRATCFSVVPTARNSPALAGAEECKQSCQRRRDSCCSRRGRSAAMLAPLRGTGLWVSLRSSPPGLGTRPAEEPLAPLPLRLAAGQGPSPAVPRLSGKPGWQQRGAGGERPHRQLCPAAGAQGHRRVGEMGASAPQRGWGTLPRRSQMLLGT